MSWVRVDDGVHVEVLFGSQSRGDHDQASDRDILIVDDRPAALRRRAQILAQQGWSVAPYTYRKLEALAGRGALFVQHLKMEGKVLKDAHGRYSQIVSEFRPKQFYTNDIRENARLAGLLTSQPQTGKGALWAADVLYVAVRNFGVLWLAEQGEYTFSYRRIISQLIGKGLIEKEGESALLKLRLLKALYRSGEPVQRPVAHEAVAVALSALPRRYFPALSEAIDPCAIVRRCTPLPEMATAYSRLRNLEKAYVALVSLTGVGTEEGPLRELDRWIKNPRAYAQAVIRNECDVLAKIALELQNKVGTHRGWRSKLSIWPGRHLSSC